MNISVFKDTFSNEPINFDHDKLIQYIINGRWQEEIEHLRSLPKEKYDKEKVLLPAITWSGTFKKRLASEIIEYSQIICLDVDHLQPEVINILKAKLTEDPYVYFAFTSPSGAGLKILCRVNTQLEHHRHAFLHLQKYFQEKYEFAVDKSGKDVSRLCFVSWDPSAVHKKSEVFEVDLRIGEVEKEYVPNEKFANNTATDDTTKKYDVCLKWTERTHQYTEGNRNNFLHTLACTMNRVGVNMEDTIYLLNNDFDLPEAEIRHVCKSAYFHNQDEYATVKITDTEKIEAYKAPLYIQNYTDDVVMNDVMQITGMLYHYKVPRKEMLDVMGKVARYYKYSGILDLDRKDFVSILNEAITKYNENKAAEASKKSLEFMLAEELARDLIKNYSDDRAIVTPFTEMNALLRGGLQPSNFYEVIGTDETYKSILAQWLCFFAACRQNVVTLFLSGEMSKQQFYERLCLMALQVNLREYLSNKILNENSVDDFIDRMNQETGGNIFFVQGNGWDKESILASVEKIKLDHGKEVGMVVIDGLTQMSWGKNRDEISATIKNAEICKEIAKEAHDEKGLVVLGLLHISGENNKLFRATNLKVRGGIKTVANADGYFCTSLFAEPGIEDNPNDMTYVQGKFFLRFTDKRGGGGTINNIIHVPPNLRLEVEQGDPNVYEVGKTYSQKGQQQIFG